MDDGCFLHITKKNKKLQPSPFASLCLLRQERSVPEFRNISSWIDVGTVRTILTKDRCLCQGGRIYQIWVAKNCWIRMWGPWMGIMGTEISSARIPVRQGLVLYHEGKSLW